MNLLKRTETATLLWTNQLIQFQVIIETVRNSVLIFCCCYIYHTVEYPIIVTSGSKRGKGDWKIEHMDIWMNNFHTFFHTLFVYSINSKSFLNLFFRFLAF